MYRSEWEEFNHFRAKEILIEVEYVKAHRTKKEGQQKSLFKKKSLEAMNKRVS